MMKKALNQTEVLEPQDPKPASRASLRQPPSACAKVRSGRKLENAKSARIKRGIVDVVNTNEVPENRLPETRNGAYQKLTSSVFAEEHCKLENPCHPSWKSSK
jgi:hypothetical protein